MTEQEFYCFNCGIQLGENEGYIRKRQGKSTFVCIDHKDILV